MFDVKQRTIFYTKHGSHAYGLNTEFSDEDFRGVCIPPKEYFYGFVNGFEQYESLDAKNKGEDCVIYSLKKFAKLAANCNPNIIEFLYVDQSDVQFCDEFGEELLANREMFLSKRAKITFSGYALSALKKIKAHKSFVENEVKQPTRKVLEVCTEETLNEIRCATPAASHEGIYRVAALPAV